MDQATKLAIQLRALALREEDIAIEFELVQLNAKIRHMGKRQADGRKLLTGLQFHLDQSWVQILADIELGTTGELSAELAADAKEAQEHRDAYEAEMHAYVTVKNTLAG